jgi:hypothetical protein
MTRRSVLAAAAAGLSLQAQAGQTRYVRFRKGTRTAYGVVRGEEIEELTGDYLKGGRPNGPGTGCET